MSIAHQPLPLSLPLSEVTFCVLDLETTGTSDDLDEIVEVGAILIRGGRRLGTFQTLVRHPANAGGLDRPAIGAVLASLLEFLAGAVVVGHNVAFDLRFLNAALWRSGRDVVLDPRHAIDTMPLARQLLRDDADDCRLATLADRFGFTARPTHRALADAAATAELLHLLIERATFYGALDLDDLLHLPALMRHRHRAKLSLTAGVPRQSGAAALRDRAGGLLHHVIGHDLRHQVRALFDPAGGGGGGKVPAGVVQHLHRIDVVQNDHPVVARLVGVRWRGERVGGRHTDTAYLHAGHDPRRPLRLVTDPTMPGIVAGPLPRATARAVVATLAGGAAEDLRRRFLTALDHVGVDADAGGEAPLDGLLAHVAARQRALAAARSRRGPVEIDGGHVTVDDGRVDDIVIGGRSWAEQLPAVGRDHRRGLSPTSAMTAAHALEAAFVAELLDAQPVCWMRDC